MKHTITKFNTNHVRIAARKIAGASHSEPVTVWNDGTFVVVVCGHGEAGEKLAKRVMSACALPCEMHVSKVARIVNCQTVPGTRVLYSVFVHNPDFKKVFRVIAISDRANSFGLTGHVLVARDGQAFEVARCRGGGALENWNFGHEVLVPMVDGQPVWAVISCEIPRELPAPSAALLKEMFA